MSDLGRAIAREAEKYVGYPYAWAGKDPSGFDCSGFVRFVIQRVTGEDISPDSHAQMYVGMPVDRSDIQPGDILGYDTMYGTEVRHGNAVSHVGIYLGNNRMMNCLNPQLGCRVSDISSPYWLGEGARFIEARRFPAIEQNNTPRERTERRHAGRVSDRRNRHERARDRLSGTRRYNRRSLRT